MDAQKKKIVLGSFAGVCLLVAAFLILRPASAPVVDNEVVKAKEEADRLYAEEQAKNAAANAAPTAPPKPRGSGRLGGNK